MTPDDSPDPAPVVIRIAPTAHVVAVFLTLGLLIPVLTWPLTAPLLTVPVLLAAAVIRLRTVADRQTVTVRTLTGVRTVPWSDIDGLGFTRGSWARAQLREGEQLRLPAVTFATLPLLSVASGGRVPNPYR